jgi:hypothetical protein
LAICVISCAGGNGASGLAKAPEYQPKDQTKCGVAKSHSRPLIVEWPSADRQELESKLHTGLVVVRYQGCEMDVLERCTVPAQYGYRGTTPAQDSVVMKDEDDLYAALPIGAAKLEGKLEKSGKLTVDMNLVGRYEAQKTAVRTDELQGDCAGATHFVYGAAVGAFAFYAGGEARVGGAAGLGGAGAGASSQAVRESLTKNGDPAACAKATTDDKAPPEGCGALIRIEVVPLVGSLTGIWTASGYGCTDDSQPPKEEIRVVQDGTQLTAVKVTGDNCVLAGSVTWQGTITGTAFPVRVTGGHPGNPSSVAIDAQLKLIDLDHFEISFSDGEPPLTFQRVGR